MKGKSSGIGFCGALTIVFIVLKLVGVIDWSWLWVFSPVLLSAVTTIIFLIVVKVFFRR